MISLACQSCSAQLSARLRLGNFKLIMEHIDLEGGERAGLVEGKCLEWQDALYSGPQV